MRGRTHLNRGKDDLFIEVIDPQDGGFDVLSKSEDYFEYEDNSQYVRHTVLPVGLKFVLSGRVRKTEPWGVKTLGGAGMYYFEANVLVNNGKLNSRATYWFGEGDLSVLTRFSEESPLNVDSANAVGVGLWGGGTGLGVGSHWQCPLGERRSKKVSGIYGS